MGTSMAAVRDGLKNRLSTIPPLQGRIYSFIPGTQEPPSCTIVPGTFIPGDTKAALEYDKSFAGGSHGYVFTLMLVVSRVDQQVSEEALDNFISVGTSNSVRDAIEGDITLGGIVSYTRCDRVIQYGALQWNGQDYFGAQVVVDILS